LLRPSTNHLPQRVEVDRHGGDALAADVGIDRVRDLLVRVPDDLGPQLPNHVRAIA